MATPIMNFMKLMVTSLFVSNSVSLIKAWTRGFCSSISAAVLMLPLGSSISSPCRDFDLDSALDLRLALDFEAPAGDGDLEP